MYRTIGCFLEIFRDGQRPQKCILSQYYAFTRCSILALNYIRFNKLPNQRSYVTALHLEICSLLFTSSSFAIRANLLHP